MGTNNNQNKMEQTKTNGKKLPKQDRLLHNWKAAIRQLTGFTDKYYPALRPNEVKIFSFKCSRSEFFRKFLTEI